MNVIREEKARIRTDTSLMIYEVLDRQIRDMAAKRRKKNRGVGESGEGEGLGWGSRICCNHLLDLFLVCWWAIIYKSHYVLGAISFINSN